MQVNHSRSILSRVCGLWAVVGLFSISLIAQADQHTTGVPALSSLPGAPYTLYLNVAGFNFDGSWSSGELGLPGTTPSVGDVAANAVFDAAQVAEIKNIWSRMAQSFVGFNINVTTVDPAVAAGQAGTDLARQAFYDATPNMMHMVIGSQVRGGAYITVENPLGKWYSTGADGVSGLNVIAGVASGAGGHTNWMFTEDQQGPGFINGDYIGAIAAHENAHALSLSHQGDWTGDTKVNTYSNGDAVGTTTTPGTYVPIIGNASDRQRVAWRVGDTTQDQHTVVNDVQRMLNQNTVANGRPGAVDLHLLDDGIGHTRFTATSLPLVGGVIDVMSSSSKGFIVPVSESNPEPMGAANYTQDWFSFFSDGVNPISLKVTDSTSYLTPGVADGVGTLRSTLSIYDAMGGLVGTGIEDASTLFVNFNSLLGAGAYYAQVNSYGGHQQIAPEFNPAQYFDMGAYFLTGSGFAVPEPSTLVVLVGMVMMAALRRSRAAV